MKMFLLALAICGAYIINAQIYTPKAGAELSLDSKFEIRVADHDIGVPSMNAENIAEMVQVTCKSVLETFRK